MKRYALAAWLWMRDAFGIDDEPPPPAVNAQPMRPRTAPPRLTFQLAPA